MSFRREYYENIKIVDDGIQNMTSLIEEYFNHDGKTSYILTSDHGMTDWGRQCYTSYLLLMRVAVDVWSNKSAVYLCQPNDNSYEVSRAYEDIKFVH